MVSIETVRSATEIVNMPRNIGEDDITDQKSRSTMINSSIQNEILRHHLMKIRPLLLFVRYLV